MVIPDYPNIINQNETPPDDRQFEYDFWYLWTIMLSLDRGLKLKFWKRRSFLSVQQFVSGTDGTQAIAFCLLTIQNFFLLRLSNVKQTISTLSAGKHISSGNCTTKNVNWPQIKQNDTFTAHTNALHKWSMFPTYWNSRLSCNSKKKSTMPMPSKRRKNSDWYWVFDSGRLLQLCPSLGISMDQFDHCTRSSSVCALFAVHRTHCVHHSPIPKYPPVWQFKSFSSW